MKLLITVIAFTVTSCGYDGSIAKVKDDLEKPVKVSEVEVSETPVTVSDAETETETETETAAAVITQPEVAADTGCTEIEGDFDVEVSAGSDAELVAGFEPGSTCETAWIKIETDGRKVHVTGGQCGNGVDQTLFSRRDLKPESIRIVRGPGFIRWYADETPLAWLTVSGVKNENAANVCRY